MSLPQVVIVADGQVTQGNQIVKPNVRKVRKIGDNVIGGFAGTVRCVCCLRFRLCNCRAAAVRVGTVQGLQLMRSLSLSG